MNPIQHAEKIIIFKSKNKYSGEQVRKLKKLLITVIKELKNNNRAEDVENLTQIVNKLVKDNNFLQTEIVLKSVQLQLHEEEATKFQRMVVELSDHERPYKYLIAKILNLPRNYQLHLLIMAVLVVAIVARTIAYTIIYSDSQVIYQDLWLLLAIPLYGLALWYMTRKITTKPFMSLPLQENCTADRVAFAQLKIAHRNKLQNLNNTISQLQQEIQTLEEKLNE
jgi:hypothetical protein